jgi:hypothetical protein
MIPHSQPVTQTLYLSPLLPKRQPKNYHPIRRQNTQPHRHRLPPGLNRSRDRAPTQHGRSQQADFLAVGLTSAQTQESEEVEGANGETGRDGGDRAGAGIPDCAAEGG